VEAARKIRALGIKEVAHLTGRSTSIVYRWLKTLDAGRPISARGAMQLINRTAQTEAPIDWMDFAPPAPEAAPQDLAA
jgi:transposase-like protein